MGRNTKTLRIPLRVVFYKDDGDWIAHCLEFDLCGDGASKEDAVESLAQAIQIQLEATVRNNNISSLFSPADGSLFRKFAAGRDMAIGDMQISVHQTPVIIESTEAREYSDDLSDNDLVPA